MAAFNSKATGDWDSEGQTTWNEVGHPTAGDTVTIQNGHTITLDSATACTTLVIIEGGVLTDATNNVGLTVSSTTHNAGTLTCGSANMSFGSGLTASYSLTQTVTGTFNGGSGNHTIGTINNGNSSTLTFTSGNTTMDSAYSINGNTLAFSASATFNHGNGTVIFTRAGTQLLYDAGQTARTFYNLTINNASCKLQFEENNGYTLTVANNLTITAGEFDTSDAVSGTSRNLTVTGITSISGTLTCNASTISLDGNVTINVGGTLVSTSGTLTFSGTTWSNSGTFTHNSGTVVFDGTSQEIDGSNTWNHFTKSVAAADTLTVDNTSVQTFEGNVTLNGVAGQLLSFVSDSGGNAFEFVMEASAVKTNLEYLSVQDSDASGSDATHKPIAPTDSVDVSGNTDWFTLSGTVVPSMSMRYYY